MYGLQVWYKILVCWFKEICRQTIAQHPGLVTSLLYMHLSRWSNVRKLDAEISWAELWLVTKPNKYIDTADADNCEHFSILKQNKTISDLQANHQNVPKCHIRQTSGN